jgi:hypothetical protein
MPDCCSSSSSASVGINPPVAPMACPRCGRLGKGVSLLTLKHQVRPAHLSVVENGPFWFCGSPECPAVYFNAAGVVLVLNDVRRVPTAKISDNPRLCYCFGFDTAMVRAEIAATGRCTIPERIRAEMKAGRCACAIRNPQGSCCFAHVTAAVKRELTAVSAKPAAG